MTAESGLDAWAERLARATVAIPYLVLLLSLVLTLAAGGPERGSTGGLLVVAAITAAWMLWWVALHPTWAGRPLMVGYLAGLIVLFALLQYRHPLFGFFAFAGYIHAEAVLSGRWRVAGIAATAAVSATALYGGVPPRTWSGGLLYALLIVMIVVLAVVLSSVGRVTSAQSEHRRRSVATLAELNTRLEDTLVENAGLHAQLLTQAREAGVLDERQRMAREIHDTIAQGLIGILTQVQAAEQARDRPEDWKRHLGHAADLARSSLSEARRSVHADRPEALESAQLPEALAEVARRWSSVTGVAVEVVTTGTARPLRPEAETTLLRTGQEALANVAKHARASRVGLTLSYMEDVTVLDIRDDGVGFDPAGLVPGPAAGDGGYGLVAMRERIGQVGGMLAVESELGGGTAVSATVPTLGPADDR